MRFRNALLKQAKTGAGAVPVIPDIKCFSPLQGDLLQGRCPVASALQLVDAGAMTLSNVTESVHFGGSLELLRTLVAACDVPILRKDFVTCEADLDVTVACGAAAVLLIYATIGVAKVEQLYQAAVDRGLEVVVEARTREHLRHAKELAAPLVGINNRDITRFELDDGTVENTCELIEYAPKDALIISESGILTPADVRRVVDAGADAVLIGTALWQAPDLATAYRSFSGL